jgi:FkbM family methyltransferase
MKASLVRLVKKVPLVRAAWHALRPKSASERLDLRDRRLIGRILPRLLGTHANGVDVGAHAGEFLAAMIRLAPAGRHFAFEPIAGLAEQLQRRFPQASVGAIAVSDQAGIAPFHHIATNPAFSGLNLRTDLGREETVDVVSVRTERLDALIPDSVPIRLIKIDVEGAELSVLRGARRILSRDRPWVVFEHGAAAALYGTTTQDLYREFTSYGLSVWRLDDWLLGRPPLSEGGLVEAVASGQYWNFLAGPAPAAQQGHPPQSNATP